MKRFIRITLITLIMMSIFFFSQANVLKAKTYSTSFANQEIKITKPVSNKEEFKGILPIEGKSDLDKVWFCLRGPEGEITRHFVNVNDGKLKKEIHLRFGPGTYTIWAGKDRSKFDGSIRFKVENTQNQDTRYTSPSAYVTSENRAVVDISESLVDKEMSDRQKIAAIHEWVTENIKYDYQAYLSGKNQLIPADKVIENGKGLCRDYSFLTAALARAAGIKTRVVYGHARDKNDNWSNTLHAWNEVYINDQWIPLDTTWDAGYIKNNEFIKSPSEKFLFPDTGLFEQTHSVTSYTLH